MLQFRIYIQYEKQFSFFCADCFFSSRGPFQGSDGQTQGSIGPLRGMDGPTKAFLRQLGVQRGQPEALMGQFRAQFRKIGA